MITDHVYSLRLPPDDTVRLMAAAVPARGGMEDRRDIDPAPPTRRLAAAGATPPETELGGPGHARRPAQRDTESAPPRAAAPGHPGNDPALAPRNHPPPLDDQVHARQDRPASHPPDYPGPGSPAGPGEPRMELPQDPRELAGLGVRIAASTVWRSSRPTASTPHRDGPGRPGHSSCLLRPRRPWPATSSVPSCSMAPKPMSWP